MGRVDGIVLDYRQEEPLRLTAILIGPSVLAHRLHPVIGRWVAASERWFGLDQGRPVRVDVEDVTDITRNVKLSLSIRQTAAGTLEERLSTWLAKIPGGR